MLLIAALSLCISTSGSRADQNFIILQSTTSTQNSGLYDAILPEFRQATGIDVRVVAVGTGQAIKNATNCDGDVLLVHSKSAEVAFVEAGFGLARFDVMYNDFVIVGPPDDPAGLEEAKSATDALRALDDTKHPFASRGDDSGTHKKELSLWAEAGLDPTIESGSWYRETGSGMGATLNIAVGMAAYAMTDRATWVAFGNKQSHAISFEGDPKLKNQYGVILINPSHCPRLKKVEGQKFVDWLLGEDGQRAIADYRLHGTQLFFPNAK